MLKRATHVLFACSGRALTELTGSGVRGLATAAQKEVKLPPQYGVPGRYASAVYMAAAKANQLGTVEKELSQIAEILKESETFRMFLSDPSVPATSRSKGLNAVLDKVNATDVTKRFFNVVVENKRTMQLPDILKKFEDIAAEQKGQVKATVTTAKKLKAPELDKVQKGLRKLLSPGQTLVLEERVDPTIMAGVIIDIGDKHVDMSVLSRIKKLQQIIRDAV